MNADILCIIYAAFFVTWITIKVFYAVFD